MVAGTLPASAWSAATDGRAALLDFEPPEEELPVESFPQAVRTSAIAASVATPARRVRELLDNGASPSCVRLGRSDAAIMPDRGAPAVSVMSRSAIVPP